MVPRSIARVTASVGLTIGLAACSTRSVDLGGPADGGNQGKLGGTGGSSAPSLGGSGGRDLGTGGVGSDGGQTAHAGSGGRVANGGQVSAGGSLAENGGSGGRAAEGGRTASGGNVSGGRASAGAGTSAGGSSAGEAGANALGGHGGGLNPSPVKMAVGASHACWIRRDGTLWCWGYAPKPRMAFENAEEPIRIGTDADTFVEVASGQHHGCAIRPNGTLWCWGDVFNLGVRTGEAGALGQLGTADDWSSVAVSGANTYGLRRDGSLWNLTSPDQSPIVSGEALPWSSVSVGDSHVCAIRSDRTLWCRGSNRMGQLGSDIEGGSVDPLRVGVEKDWIRVSAGAAHTCGIRSNGSLWCWGTLHYQESIDYAVPTRVGTASDWVELAAGLNHTCAIRNGGSLWCWGENRYGDLGDGTTLDQTEPIEVGTESAWSGIFDGQDYLTCGVRADESVWCWGHDEYFDGPLQKSKLLLAPRRVPEKDAWTQLAPSPAPWSRHVCGIREDSSLWCWGNNEFGQLGNGTLSTRGIEHTKTQVEPGTLWSWVAAGTEFACGIQANGSLWCWGYNAYGRLGNGDTNDSRVPDPTQVAPDHAFTTVVLGSYHACAIREDGSLWCWGAGKGLGIGESADRADVAHPSPEQVTPGTTWSQIAAARHTCGIRSDRTLWCWGVNDYGQLGDGTQTTSMITDDDEDVVFMNDRNLPTPVLGAGSWRSVAVCDDSTCAIRTDGTLWCWGANPEGQLGDGSTDRINSVLAPQQVGSDDSWLEVSMNEGHACATRSDKSLWCWGYNHFAQLGDGTTENKLAPVRIGDAPWSQLFLSSWSSAGIQSDGSLWVWGENEGYLFGIANVPMIPVGSAAVP